MVKFWKVRVRNEVRFRVGASAPADDDTVLIMAALWNRACHYIFALWFLLSSSSSFFFFFSSPNLSRRRLDVHHTSTYGVALVRI